MLDIIFSSSVCTPCPVGTYSVFDIARCNRVYSSVLSEHYQPTMKVQGILRMMCSIGTYQDIDGNQNRMPNECAKGYYQDTSRAKFV